MANILAVMQQREGRLHRMSREVLAAGQRLREQTGGRITALVLGAENEGAVGEVQALALDGALNVEHAALSTYTPGAWVDAIGAVLDETEFDLVLFPHTYQSIDFMARLAQRRGAALVPEVTGFENGDQRLIWKRPILGGKLESKVVVDGEGLIVVSVQSGAFSVDDLEAGACEVSQVTLVSEPVADREILGTEAVAGDQVDLSQATSILAVGRGLGDVEKLGPVEELAAELGAEIAASRPVIDNGWLPRDRQIGSSGQTVSPKLYVALGVSGAIQHLVGMKGSKTIVAVNKDVNAPIFSVADYGYVGDLHEFVPAFTRALQESGGE
jgi:electron transfer flavoprotein alpha subunit